MEPEKMTDAALFDALHEAYGVGEIKPGEEWYQTRLREIGVVKRVRESRKLDIHTMFRALRYAQATRQDVRHVSWLPKLVKDADRWYLKRMAAEEDAEIASQMDAAISYEHDEDPEGPWLNRLVRAVGDERAVVLEEWRAARGRP